MYSRFVPFEEIIEGVKDDTGVKNLDNNLPQIRRLLYRVQQDIGYGSSLVMKRITYSIEDSSIIEGNPRKVRLPEDIVKIEAIGMCKEGLCPGDYNIQGNWLFLCKKNVDKFSFVYYTLLCDGNGNPAVSLNHKEAIISGISYYMYKPKRWQDKGSRVTFKDLENYYEDRIGEARGADVWPDTAKEWSAIAAKLRMSASQTLIYNNEQRCYCCIEESENPTIPANNEGSTFVYYWQFNDFVTNIDFAPNINQSFLDLQNVINIQEFLNGTVISYSKIGRIAFAIKNSSENEYNIYDLFNNDITDIVFDKYYNSGINMQVYISKEYYTHGNIYFQLIQN